MENVLEANKMQEEELNKAASDYIDTQDSETRRMYGHHMRSFKAGADYARSKQAVNPKLEETFEAVVKILASHVTHTPFDWESCVNHYYEMPGLSKPYPFHKDN